MTRHTYIIAFIIGLSGALLAQNKNVPGYMGKRWNLQYNAFLFPAFINPNSSEVKVEGGDLKGSFSVNFQNHITAGFSYSKKMEFVAEFNMARTNFNPYPSYLDAFAQSSLYYPELKARGGAIGVRLYSKHFAPLGSHISFKLGFTKLNIEDLYYTYQDYNGLQTEAFISGGTKMAPTLSVGFGTNRIIKDFLIISYGLDLTLYTGLIGSANPFDWLDNIDGGPSIYPYNGNSSDNRDAYLGKAAQRYGLMSLVNFKLGVGIVL